MARESDLEKIELKVSVNCCDGCKKKVKKALQSIEGVLKIEVDSQQPKVTVLGNVDPQILMKRLSKVGKQAEVRRHGKQNAAAMEKKGEGEIMPTVAKAKEKQPKTDPSECQSDDQQAKPSSDSNTRKDEGADKGSKKKEETSCESTELIKMGNPFPFPAQYALTIPVPCYAVPPYAYAAAAAPPPLQTCCSQEYYHHQPPLYTPTTRVGDYFSDENTLGCSVM